MKQRVAERKKEIQKKGIKKDKIKKSDPVLETCVGREIAAKYTKGTYQKPVPIADFLEGKEDNDEELDTKYVLLYLYDEEKNTFGVTYFDITTLQFSIGQFQDDSMKNKFRTLITRIRPVEVLCEAKFMKSDMSKMLRSSPIPPTFSNITAQEKIDYLASKDIIEFYLKSESGKMPKLIQKAMENSDNYSLALSALGNSIKYLQFLMIADKTVPLAEFYEYSHERSTTLGDRQKNSAMILDAQALENLEILEVQGKLSRIHEGSLLHHVDRCSTKFGKRLLKKWICSPLFDDKKLIGRHDAVEYLVKHDTLLNKFKKKMRKYADLERYLCRIYKYSISTNSNAIYVNENSLSRLDELYILLSQLEDITKDISDIFGDHKDISAHRLKALVTFQPREYSKGFGTKKIKKKIKNKYKKEETKGIPREESKQEIKDGDMNADSEEDEKEAQKYKDELNNRLESDGILPDIRPELETFRKVITWKTIGKKKFPEPTKGLSEDFDNANEKVEQLKASISN